MVKSYAKSACHNYVIKAQKRDRLNAYLKEHGISSGMHYISNNHYEMYKGCRDQTPVCEKVWTTLLTLPLYPDLKDEEVDLIIRRIKEFEI